MSEYVYFLKEAGAEAMKVGHSGTPFVTAKALSEEIDLAKSRVIVFPDKETAQAVAAELCHSLKNSELPEKKGWYKAQVQEALFERVKQLGLKVEPLLD